MKPLMTLLERQKFVERLVAAYHRGELGGDVMPEDALKSAVWGDVDKLDVLTLGMSLNYQRNSYSLWSAVSSALDDEASRWVFSPIEVIKRSHDDLQETLIRHRIALQPNKHPEIWSRNAAGIHIHSGSGSVRGIIKECNSRVSEVKSLVSVREKRSFPYLSGPKIMNYWLYVLETYGGVSWLDRGNISVAPDTHILQASVRLGISPPSVLDGTAASRELVAQSWAKQLSGSILAPIDVHTPLWLWSRANFKELQ